MLLDTGNKTNFAKSNLGNLSGKYFFQNRVPSLLWLWS